MAESIRNSETEEVVSTNAAAEDTASQAITQPADNDIYNRYRNDVSASAASVLNPMELLLAQGPGAVPAPGADRGPDAPPAPGDEKKPKIDETERRALETLKNKLTINDVPPELFTRFNKMYQQSINDATSAKTEASNEILKAAGVTSLDRTPYRVKMEKLAEHFDMKGSSNADVQKRFDAEVRKKLGVPEKFNAGQETDYLRVKQFLKDLGDLPYNASKRDQIEALKKIP